MIPDKMQIVGLGVYEKALVVADSLVKTRKELFTQVYWHHTVRSLKAMLGFAIRNTLLSLEEVRNKNKKEEFWYAFHSEILWVSGLGRNYQVNTVETDGDTNTDTSNWSMVVS